ncbi:MAG TPA: polyphosphate kinase 2 family protein [Thermoplasmata archaeon]|nr:polyphosphate kinase 2 family protein [Thermoplasmata archaeon]
MDRYRVREGQKVRLDSWDPGDTSAFQGKKKDGLDALADLREKLDPLQELLYAEHQHKVLVVLQGMDTSGKDGTIRRVFEGVNPQGVRVARFREPTPEESDHDFLWRAHKQVPAKGEIVIFNRSHYEGVLVERVHQIVPKEVWKRRYQEINDFERLLAEDGTAVLKFYLNIDADEQKRRLQARLDDPSKNWKFSSNDLPERRLWAEYMKAYEEALERTSTRWAPWFLVPSNHAWYRDLVVCRILVDTLQGLKMRYPRPAVDLKSIVIR